VTCPALPASFEEEKVRTISLSKFMEARPATVAVEPEAN
jgi:hypothetical protein